MSFPHSLTVREHADQLFSPERNQQPNQDLINTTMNAARHTSSFAKTIALVNKKFGEMNAQPDAQIINFLVEKKGNKFDWKIKKEIFRQLPKEIVTEQLIRGMFMEAAHWNDPSVVEEIYRTAQLTNNINERVSTLYIRTLIKCNRVALAHKLVTRTINQVKSDIQPEILAYHYISNLPDSEGERAKKIYQLLHNRNQVTPPLAAVYSRFIPSENQFTFFRKALADGLVTPVLVNHLISSFMAHNLFDEARKLFAIARKLDKIDPVTWNMIIDMEFRLVGDKQLAHKLFIADDCPIEVITTTQNNTIALDLHEHSYGVNALRVHSFIEANAKERILLLITGIGKQEDGNDLKLQSFITDFVQDYFKGRYKITTEVTNPGILILTRTN